MPKELDTHQWECPRCKKLHDYIEQAEHCYDHCMTDYVITLLFATASRLESGTYSLEDYKTSLDNSLKSFTITYRE